MEFSRIDEDTVRCILTEQDMKERGIELEDFFKNKDKVQGFFEEIVEEAKKEVSYEATSGVLAVQVMPLPENGLAIIFSENQESEFDGLLKNIKDMVGDFKDSFDDEIKDHKIQMSIFSFAALADIEDYCLAIPNDKKIKSSLYKNEKNGTFYLAIEKGRNSLKLFRGLCEKAIEFGDFVSSKETELTYLQEHLTCLIGVNAIYKIQKIALY